MLLICGYSSFPSLQSQTLLLCLKQDSFLLYFKNFNTLKRQLFLANDLTTIFSVFGRRRDVIMRGFSGYSSAHAIKILPSFMPTVEQVRVSIMVVWFGANDACLKGCSTGQHVPLEQYVQNLKDIINHSSVKAQKPRILLITPPPVDEYTMEAVKYIEGVTEVFRTAEITRKYADACRQVGEDLSLPVLDIWTIIQTKAGWKPGQRLPGSKDIPRSMVLGDLFRDGILYILWTRRRTYTLCIGLHFSPSGYKVVFEAVKEKIERTWPEESPSNLRPVFPFWQEASN